MTILRVAVIGLGIGGKIHLDAISSSNYFKAVACIGPLSDSNRNVAQHYAVPIYPSIEDCLSFESIECVIIASPNNFHLAHVRFCIENKIPCLLEKPLSSSLNEAYEIVKFYDSHNFHKVLVGHHRAHSLILNKSIAIISSGCLGELVGIQGSAQFYKPDSYFDDGPWRRNPGGGPVLINMIHEIDILRRLAGEIATVYCVCSSKVRRFPVEDSSAIIFEFVNGAIGTFFLSDCVPSSRSWELTSGENPAYPRQSTDCYFVSGTEGSLAIPSLTVERYSSLSERSWWNSLSSKSPEFLSNDPIIAQLSHFYQVILDNQAPKVTIYDGFNNMLIADAILKSSRQGVKINIRAYS